MHLLGWGFSWSIRLWGVCVDDDWCKRPHLAPSQTDLGLGEAAHLLNIEQSMCRLLQVEPAVTTHTHTQGYLEHSSMVHLLLTIIILKPPPCILVLEEPVKATWEVWSMCIAAQGLLSI